MTGRIGFVVRTAAATLAALVLAHSLIFLAGYGAAFGDVLSHTGHDHGWTVAALATLMLGGSLFAVAAWRVRFLWRMAEEADAGPLSNEPGRWAFVRRWLAWWLVLAFATAVLFVIQENVEHSRVGLDLPGFGVLVSATYPGAAAIIAAVALGVSFLATLLGWKLELLTARLLAASSRARRGLANVVLRPELVDRLPGSILGRRLAGRAPPISLAS